jgi:hypothetical protein
MIIKDERLNFDSCKELLYKIVKEKLNVTKEEILSKKRDRTLADSRRVIMKILKNKFPYCKVVVLGGSVNRDHSSASIQLKNHDELIRYPNDYSDLFHLINDEFEKVSFKNFSSLQELYEAKNGLEAKLNIVNSLIYQFEKKSENK